MTQIEPALVKEEWTRVHIALARFEEMEVEHALAKLTENRLPFREGKGGAVRIAVENAALPDDSPYKITREDVERLELLAEEDEHVHELRRWPNHVSPWRRFANKLAALLPPND
jgi:hypothetical protein